ncbi:probable F-box protein At3g61730 [Salvia hispanica]|uniref:probable F-box protein At3g61730 n=1 Tax=Salvia hispanica TaxID=49212 RepID=UPI002008FC43|nr:probable F-box protein At3g61730 [Salvia hispanica]
MDEVAKLLYGRSLVMLAVTCKWFRRIMMEDSLWKYSCLRDLHVPDPGNVTFKWIELYTTAFDGSHTYIFRQQEKHIDWVRIEGFLFDSPDALLTESLIESIKTPKEETSEKLVQKEGYCLLNNTKTGIWMLVSTAFLFEDLHLVRCPVCDLGTCDGTMQTLDARHIELFLSEDYRSGSWDYHLFGSHNVNKQADGAFGGIFNVKYLNDESTSDIFDLKFWVGKRNDWKPKAMITLHAVAVNTNLQDNEVLQITYHAMRAGKDSKVVSIRISQ